MTDNRAGSNLYGVPSNRCFIEDQETEADTFRIFRHYQMLSAGKPVPVSTAMDNCEGLSCLPDECWRDLSAKTDLPWQFGPGNPLDVDSQYITVEESPMPGLGDFAVSNDCKKASESDLEWQWIMDQQQTYKSEWFSSNKFEDTTTTDDLGNATDKEEVPRAETDSSTTTSSLFSGSKTEQSSDAGTSNSSKVSGNLSVELNVVKASQRDCAVWRTADSKELAALVSQKGHGYLENCDLPHSQSSYTWKGSLASCDLSSLKDVNSANSSADKVFLPSLLCRQELSQSENRSLPSSKPIHSASMSEPQPIPSTLPQPSSIKSSEDQMLTWKSRSGRHVGVSKRGFEALGEALCHSQTRARQAEKLASQALQEREKLAQLLFRESWTSRTYKQWVQTLEFENMWLKLCCGRDMEVWMGKELSDISSAAEQIVITPLKHIGKCSFRKKTHHRLSSEWEGRYHKPGSAPESSVWLRCTIGLAFALGLSFAGAGLMIGWSMGWILLSY